MSDALDTFEIFEEPLSKRIPVWLKNELEVEELFLSRQLQYERDEDALATPIPFDRYKEQACEAISTLNDMELDFRPYSIIAIGTSNIVFGDALGRVMRFNHRNANLAENAKALTALNGVTQINRPIAHGEGWSYAERLVTATFDIGVFSVKFIREYYKMGVQLLKELKARKLYYCDWFIDNLGLTANNEIKLIDTDFFDARATHNNDFHHKVLAKWMNTYVDRMHMKLDIDKAEQLTYIFDDACFRCDIMAMIKAIKDEHKSCNIKNRYEYYIYYGFEKPLSHEEIVKVLEHLDDEVEEYRCSDYVLRID